MSKGSLNFFELHVEKIVLGLAGAGVLVMAWMFLINTPNKREFGGQPVGPGDLDEHVLTAAQTMQTRIKNARPDAEKSKVTRYSQLVKDQHESGIFGKPIEGPPVVQTLRQTAPFGQRIEVPGLKEEEEAGANIAIVAPLQPERPVVQTGRSMGMRRAFSLNSDLRGGGDKSDTEPTEVVWVSLAAWFDRAAQQAAMTDAGYAAYRARVLVAGVEVQRQEMLASGDWSDWQNVTPVKAMPRMEIPEPDFDASTGAIRNKSDIDQALNVVKQNQFNLIQPTFFPVEAGDKWHTPPLEGLEDEEVSMAPPPDPAPIAPKSPGGGHEEGGDKPVGGPAVAPSGGGRTPPPGGGRTPPGGGRSPGGHAGGSEAIGGRQPGPAGGGGAGREKAEAQKQAETDLREAGKALRKKDYEHAIQLATAVISNPEAPPTMKRRAQKLLDDATAQLAKSDSGDSSKPVVPRPDKSKDAVVQTEGLPYVSPDGEKVALLFHDDSVESGKTYRYRMRVKLWNRYVGQMRSVKDPDGAKRAVLLGDWSPASDPVTVPPSTYFFVRGKSPRNDVQAASLEVWKWRAGKWIKESFDAAVGDVIGGPKKAKLDSADGDGKGDKVDVDFTTGAIVLDLRFDERVRQRVAGGKGSDFKYNEVTSVVLVYLDPADGQVKERVAAFDKEDPIRRKLDKGS